MNPASPSSGTSLPSATGLAPVFPTGGNATGVAGPTGTGAPTFTGAAGPTGTGASPSSPTGTGPPIFTGAGVANRAGGALALVGLAAAVFL